MTRKKYKPAFTQVQIQQIITNKFVGVPEQERRIIMNMLRDYAILVRREEEAALQKL